MKVAVAGAGIFGSMVAIHLAERGWPVCLIDRQAQVMSGASRTANRLHLGFHYPRDAETARQCIAGFEGFRSAFADAVLPGHGNAYFIAREGSLTSPEQFLSFCDGLGLAYREIDPGAMRPRVENVELGISTDELMFDPEILQRLVAERLARSGVEVRLGAEVRGVARRDDGRFGLSFADGDHTFDGLVNCTYGNLNRLRAGLGLAIETRQYEYTAAPVIELADDSAASITIMDGPFFGLLPLNRTGQILLFHVEHSVIARRDRGLIDPCWLDPPTAPFATVDRAAWLSTLIEAASVYVPDLRRARVIGVREGPRMVLANAEDSDARPSIVSMPIAGYVEVFSGKVVHAMWAHAEVARLLEAGVVSPGAS